MIGDLVYLPNQRGGAPVVERASVVNLVLVGTTLVVAAAAIAGAF